MTMADELQKLHTLHEQGALTDDEYAQAKQRVLEGLDAAAPKIEKPAATAAPSTLKRFRRSLNDRWIGGVCGGLAEITQVPAWTWRILFVLTALLHGLGIVVYILLWIFVPAQLPALPAPQEVAPPVPPSPPPAAPPTQGS